MKIGYVAYDDTIFDTPEACEEYEREELCESCLCFDVKGDYISPKGNPEVSWRIEQAYYAILMDDEAVEAFTHNGDSKCDIRVNRIYFYNEDYNEWQDMQEEINNLCKTTECMKEKMNFLFEKIKGLNAE